MSTISNYGIRMNVLTAATVIALSALAAPAIAGEVNLEGLQASQGYEGFIVKYRNGSAERQNAAKVAVALNRTAQVQIAGKRITLGHVRRLAIGSDLVRAGSKLDRVEAEALMRQLATDPNVEYVEVNRLWTHTMTPNDTRYGEQWHYSGPNGLRANTAWDQASGAGTVVAVIDTGIVPHADLNANVLPGYDFVSDAARARDGNGRDANPNDEGDWVPTANECYFGSQPSNSSWHGSHVAGTIAAVTNNATGVAGVAHGARIVPVRVLGKCGGSTADIADAIVWASGGAVAGVPANANPAEVINMSLGGGGACSATYQNAINSAVGRGTTVVVAAGNSNSNVSGFTPASCNNVVAVAATDQNGDRAFYSNYGATMDVAAPGGETCSPNVRFLALGAQPRCDVNHLAQGVLSIGNTGTTVQGAQSYTFMQGTSMASPHVAGVVALMQSAVTAPLTPAQVEQALKDSVRAIPAENCPGGCGAGLVDANAAVNAAIAIGGGGGGDNVNPVANFSSSVNGLTATFTDSSTDSDGSITSRSWNFGDGTAASTATNPSHTYAAAGTYTVSLTVTDNDDATHTRTAAVTVAAAPTGSVLSNGVAKTGISGASKSNQYFTLEVPAGATGLKFVTSGGTGDADLYVKHGSQPTTTSYTCKSESPSNTETCNIAVSQAGTYHVLVHAWSAISGVSLTGSYTAGGGGAQTYSNTTDVTIRDNATVESPITVSGRSGNAPSNASVTVAIAHTFRGDLKVDLVAPDGSTYLLKTYNANDSADNVNGTVTRNLSSEALNGTWKLRVNDNAFNDSGKIDSWSITF